MVVILLLSLMTLMFSVSCNENCVLSTKKNMTWVATIRKKIEPNINQKICVGLIISEFEIVVPTRCMSSRTRFDFYTGRELKAVTGVDGDACIQTRDGVNYQSVSFDGEKDEASNLLRYVTKLEVKKFDIDPENKPADALIQHLPHAEKDLKQHMLKFKGRDVICIVPIFGPDDGKVNKAKREQLRPLEREECEAKLCKDSPMTAARERNTSCPEKLWSPETYSCFTFVDTNKTCSNNNMGSPIICDHLVCGILMRCDREHENIVIMQMLTEEHLDACKKTSHHIYI